MNLLWDKFRGFRQIWEFDNRWQLVMQRLIFPRESLLAYRLGSLTFLEDHTGGDANGAREVLTTPMYTDHLQHLRIEHPLSVLDLGANNGGFPLLLHRLGLPLSRVVSVELNHHTCERLRFNLDHNIEAPHKIVNAALCGRSTSLRVQLGQGSVGDSIYEQSDNFVEGARQVRGITFDELFQEHFGTAGVVDLCKMDVECAEYEVFASPGHGSVAYCRWLIIEIHEMPGHSPAEVVSAIGSLGFEMLPRGSDAAVYAFRNTRLTGLGT